MFKDKVKMSSSVSFGLNSAVEIEEEKRENRQGEWGKGRNWGGRKGGLK